LEHSDLRVSTQLSSLLERFTPEVMGRLSQVERDEVRSMALLLLVGGTDPTLPGESINSMSRFTIDSVNSRSGQQRVLLATYCCWPPVVVGHLLYTCRKVGSSRACLG
jgi:hypothetical protein